MPRRRRQGPRASSMRPSSTPAGPSSRPPSGGSSAGAIPSRAPPTTGSARPCTSRIRPATGSNCTRTSRPGRGPSEAASSRWYPTRWTSARSCRRAPPMRPRRPRRPGSGWATYTSGATTWRRRSRSTRAASGFPSASAPIGALFFGRDGYHHHLAVNTWQSRRPCRPGSLGLAGFAIGLSDPGEFSRGQGGLGRCRGCRVGRAGRVRASDPSGIASRIFQA